MNTVLREIPMSNSAAMPLEEPRWETVCEVVDLPPYVGVRALLGSRQVALFRINGEIHAIDAFDPFSEAAVLSRGVIGDIKGELVVASPIYKQHFSLRTGTCQEDSSVRIPVYEIRVVDGKVQIANPE
jgi:nitrite reductase (NADH) small subunit